MQSAINNVSNIADLEIGVPGYGPIFEFRFSDFEFPTSALGGSGLMFV